MRTTEESQRLIKQWVSEWGVYMGVTQVWHIVLATVPPNKLQDVDSDAETNWPTGYHTAKIKFNKKTLNKHSDAELEAIVVHELAHLVFYASYDTIEATFGKGRLREELFKAEENNVDIFSRFLIRSKYECFPNQHSVLYPRTDDGATGFDEKSEADDADSDGKLQDGSTEPDTSSEPQDPREKWERLPMRARDVEAKWPWVAARY